MRYLGKIRGKTGLLSCSTIVRTSTSHWNATPLPITLSPGLGCLLGTCRIQIWSKLRNRLRTITTLVIVGQKWVIMCPMLYRHELLLQCVHQIFEHEYTRTKIPNGTALPVDRSYSDRCLAAIAWASCCLFSVEQCLAAFARESCCLLFIITSGTSQSRFHNFSTSLLSLLFSVHKLHLFLACETLSPLKTEFGRIPEVLVFPSL